MVNTVKAIYEEGVLKLTQPLSLAEGSRVDIIVIPAGSSGDQTPAEILAEIAALPVEGAQDNFSGRDHDRVLYPTSDVSTPG